MDLGRFFFCAALLLATGCPSAAAESTPAPAPQPSSSAAAPGEASSKPEPEKGHAGKRAESTRIYTLPFVKEPGEEDPGDRARGFLREFVRDNAAFVRGHDAKYFKPFVDSQKPRATLVTCSDSRVQSWAFDSTPDNDLFTIRNIGNQIGTAAGSVEYGIEHLKTPLLVIMGHSGCGAVKAAMGDFSKEPQPIRRELETIDLSPLGAKHEDKREKEKEAHGSDKHGDGKPRSIDGAAWIDAVVSNVHHQVAAALAEFADPVATHDLIVVGAVYDFRNDMRLGYGSVSIVNVNGHTEPAKIAAFVKALDADTAKVATGERPLGFLGVIKGSVMHDAVEPEVVHPASSAK